MTRPAVRRLRMRVWEASVLVPLIACAFGCLTADGTVKPDGSATFEMTYRTPPNSTADAEKKRFGSDHVTVESVSFANASTATLKARVDDVTKLSTAEGFKTVTVTRTNEGDDTKLTITVQNPLPAAVKDEGQPGPKITLHLPGAVREADHDGKVSGDTVTWSFTFVDWMKAKSTSMSVRYAGGAKPGGTDAAKTPPAGAVPGAAPAGKTDGGDAAAPGAKAKNKAAKH